MNNPINVPILVEAMWCDNSSVAPPHVNFTELKSTIPTPSENFGNVNPWLGDTTHVSFQDSYELKKGIHLHWTLPKALRHGSTICVIDYEILNELVYQGIPCSLVLELKNNIVLNQEYTLEQIQKILKGLIKPTSKPIHTASDFELLNTAKSYTNLISDQENIKIETFQPSFNWDVTFLELYTPLIIKTISKMKFPTVPNRWLVVRKNTSNNTFKSWVIESDRLTPPKFDEQTDKLVQTDNAGPAAVPGEYYEATINKKEKIKKNTTFQWLGFKQKAENWSENTSSNYLSPLTAGGNGTLEFASFYPNCQGVFGFHDTEASPEETYQYTITGWFSNDENDPISDNYKVKPWSEEKNVKLRLKKLEWLTSSKIDWSQIDGSIYTASILVQSNSCKIQNKTELNDVKVSVGNTTGESLSAYLNTFENTEAKKEIALGLNAESILNATQAGVLKDTLSPDGPSTIENCLHSMSFQSIPGGWLWKLKEKHPKHAGLSNEQHENIALPASLANALNTLNAAQMKFDQLQEWQKTQRHLLFTDWCRALHLETDVSGTKGNESPNGITSNEHVQISITDLSSTVIINNNQALNEVTLGQKNNTGKYTIMPIYQASKVLYLAHVTVLKLLNSFPEFQLQRIPAPRYWKPEDPAIMMVGKGKGELQHKVSGKLPFKIINGKYFLELNTITPSQSKAFFLPNTWNQNALMPDSSIIKAIIQQSKPFKGCTSWRPISLHWESNYTPIKGAGNIEKISTNGNDAFNVKDFSTSFIQENFSIDISGINLLPNSNIKYSSKHIAIYNGRVPLTNQALETMKHHILKLTGQIGSPPSTASGLKLLGLLDNGLPKHLITTAYNSKADTLSQSLNGFHDQLLMLNRIAQLSSFSPNYNNQPDWLNNGDSTITWDANLQSFYKAIGMQKRTSPNQNDIYNPIRAGICEITSLSIIDAFGQIRNWNYETKNTAIAQSLPNKTATGANAAPRFFMPPRFSQASRLLFRWLSANGNNYDESNDSLNTSPICGWLALNRVDENIMFFNKKGELICWVNDDGGTPNYMPQKSKKNLNDPYMIQVLNQALVPGNSLYDDINTNTLTIEPKSFRQHTGKSILESPPLAIARASAKIELLGTPSPHQGYEALVTLPIKNFSPAIGIYPPFLYRETCAFEKVTVPTRLGDVSADDDGLVLWWNINKKHISKQYTTVDEISHTNTSLLELNADPLSLPKQVLLLLDPRAPIHITSGILPVKDISIPTNMYTDTVKQMEYIMQVTPLLTADNDHIEMPLPTESTGQWYWIENEKNGWTTPIKPTKVDGRIHPSHKPAILKEGFLKIKNESN